MGYRELLQALEEEVGRKIQEGRAAAAREESLVLETARAEIRARRVEALETERRRLAEEKARRLSSARLEQARALLAQMRRQMSELLGEAEARLAALNDRDLLARLVEELVPELGEGPVVLRVRPGYERQLESHLQRHHTDLLARATIEGSTDVGGGVEASLGERQRLDNTLASRLQSAWRQLEPEIAAILFEQEGDEPGVERAREEPVEAASVAGGRDGPL
jgi:V/A-type H+-transporting ATPase subunit E